MVAFDIMWDRNGEAVSWVCDAFAKSLRNFAACIKDAAIEERRVQMAEERCKRWRTL